MGFEDIMDDGEDVHARLAVANAMADHFQEAYADSARALLAAEDIGWNRLGGGLGVDQIPLDSAKEVARKLSGYTESNPLLSRGKEIRCSYLFSSRYEVTTEDAKGKVTPQQQNVIDDPANQAAVFGMEALERLEGERYSSGQVFVLYDRSAKRFQQISFQEIGDIIYDPDNATEIRYVRRDWSAVIVNALGVTQEVQHRVYYPTAEFSPAGGYMTTINNIRVDDTKRMIVDRVNVKPGGNLGIPDAFAAAPWALAYSSYLSDGSKVLAALAEWAWVVKPKRRPAAERAAATVRSERGAGGTLFTDADVSPMPTSNAIDLNTGRPLAAQVASALGVSIVLLLADPGQSGAYGTAQTLSDPNRRTMEARRERNTAFLKTCLRLIGMKKPDITWPKMSPGSDSDEMSIVAQAWGSGLFDGETEIRPRMAELAHIQMQSDNAPAGFMTPNNEKSLPRKDIDGDGQGEVHADGSTSMSNGQGRDSAGVGNLSKAKKSGGGAQGAARQGA